MRWLLVVLTSLAYLATYSASEAEHKEITGTSTKKKDGSRKDKRGFGFGYGGFGYGGGMSYLAYSPIGHNLVYSVGYPVMAHGIALAPLDIGTLAIGSPLVAHAHAPIGGTASPEVSAQAIRTIPAPQLGPGIQGNRLGPATFGVQSGSNRPFSSKIASGTANIGRGVGNTITSGQVVPFGGQNGFLRPQGRPISQGGPTSMNVPPGQAGGGGNQGGFGGGQSGTGGGQTGFGGGQTGFGGGQAGFGGGPLGLDGVQGAFGGGQGGYGGGQFLLDGVQGAFISGPGGYAGGQGQQGGFSGGQSAPPGGQGGPFGSQGAIGFQGGNQAAFPGNQLGGVISNLGNLDLVGGQENYAPPLQGYGNGIQSRTGSPTGGSAISLGG